MFHGEAWFAWHPVRARTRGGNMIWIWLTYVWKDHMPGNSQPASYYL